MKRERNGGFAAMGGMHNINGADRNLRRSWTRIKKKITVPKDREGADQPSKGRGKRIHRKNKTPARKKKKCGVPVKQTTVKRRSQLSTGSVTKGTSTIFLFVAELNKPTHIGGMEVKTKEKNQDQSRKKKGGSSVPSTMTWKNG